ncbi:hypothetical protein M9H77_06781 [Catharanthus roseus]|uniref:Uncharacterized protein n=1 Tax=Catharanthus roseus TaxID=4058 RepID=A0ACC0BT63_CATRO|nr:hypothetical protein M9H77_06781 [Catharanthus roseus]
MAQGHNRALGDDGSPQPTPSLAPQTPASMGEPLLPPSTSQATSLTAPLTVQDPPMTLAGMGGHLVLPSPTQPTPSQAPPKMQDPLTTSQPYALQLTQSLSSRSSSTGLTILGLISRSQSKICGRESFRNDQKDLIKKFSQSKYLEELHKPQKGKKKRKKAEEDAEPPGAHMPDDLQLMSIVASGASRDRLYGARSKGPHFIVESSRAAVGLAPCCLEHE